PLSHLLLPLHALELGFAPAFTVLDRSDSCELLDVLRHQLGLSERKRRFPRKATCLAIYSRVVNAQVPLERCLDEAFPWCKEWAQDLKQLFASYVDSKQRHHVLDYDDLLLYWNHLMGDARLAGSVGRRVDHVLVD